MNITEGSKLKTGIIVLLIGVYFLMGNFNLLGWFDIGKLWPLILVAIGISLIFRK